MRLEGARPKGFVQGFGAVQAGMTDRVSGTWNTAGSTATEDMPRKPRRRAVTGCLSAAARKRLEALGGSKKQMVNQEEATGTAFTCTARLCRAIKAFAFRPARRPEGVALPSIAVAAGTAE